MNYNASVSGKTECNECERHTRVKKFRLQIQYTDSSGSSVGFIQRREVLNYIRHSNFELSCSAKTLAVFFLTLRNVARCENSALRVHMMQNKISTDSRTKLSEISNATNHHPIGAKLTEIQPFKAEECKSHL